MSGCMAWKHHREDLDPAWCLVKPKYGDMEIVRVELQGQKSPVAEAIEGYERRARQCREAKALKERAI